MRYRCHLFAQSSTLKFIDTQRCAPAICCAIYLNARRGLVPQTGYRNYRNWNEGTLSGLRVPLVEWCANRKTRLVGKAISYCARVVAARYYYRAAGVQSVAGHFSKMCQAIVRGRRGAGPFFRTRIKALSLILEWTVIAEARKVTLNIEGNEQESSSQRAVTDASASQMRVNDLAE